MATTCGERSYSSGELYRDSWRGLKPAVFTLITSPMVNPLVRFVGRMLPHHMRRRLPIAFSAIEYRVGSKTVRLLDTKRDQVAKDVYWGCPVSRSVWRLITRMAPQADLFVDIGAYTGFYSLIACAANPKLQAVAFEILPESYAALKANVAANGLPVQCRLNGLSDHPGTVAMPRATGAVSHPAGVSLASDFGGDVQVPVSTLDAEKLSGRLLIKIDVEGFEHQVFRGAVETIKRCLPVIFCEFLPGSDPRPIEDMLRPLGYRFLIITAEGHEEREEIIPEPNFRDWLLTPPRSGPRDRTSLY